MVKKHPHKLSRRGFVVGAAAVAASTAAASVALGGCQSVSAQQAVYDSVRSQFPKAKLEYLDVDPAQVLPHTEMTMVDSVEYLRETQNFELPLGSLVYQSSDTQALVVAPGASSKALIRLGLVQLDSGNFSPFLDEALGSGEDYVIYDARASSDAVVWVECNMVHGLWRVYAAHIISGAVGEGILQEPHLLDEGVESHVPPQVALSGTKVYWTVMPDAAGPAATEDSYLKAVELNAVATQASVEPKIVYTSHGRMIATPLVSGDLITFVPRVDTDAVYYQLTTMDIATDTVQNIAILPPSLRVSDAVWLGDGFAFGIEGNYDYAKGLSLFGTYLQLGDGQFLYTNKAPTSAAMRMESLTFVKSTKNVLGLDPANDSVAIVRFMQDCVAYGDIMAGVGEQNRLVIYTTVTSRMGLEKGRCRVRVFDAI
ncbi:MAG: hypothetical protein FWD27_03550 [Coriobacteriia bacterium]|nr:hypothetical protein [Coriobacteriia bacterium]